MSPAENAKKEPLVTLTLDSLDQIPQAVHGLLQRWYEAEVRSLAEDYAKRLRDGEWGKGEDLDEEGLNEDLEQTIDGHEYVIYTWQARCVCAASDNEDTYAEEFGTAPPTVEAQAYTAMLRDVRECSIYSEALDEVRDAEDEDDAENEDEDEAPSSLPACGACGRTDLPLGFSGCCSSDCEARWRADEG